MVVRLVGVHEHVDCGLGKDGCVGVLLHAEVDVLEAVRDDVGWADGRDREVLARQGRVEPLVAGQDGENGAEVAARGRAADDEAEAGVRTEGFGVLGRPAQRVPG